MSANPSRVFLSPPHIGEHERALVNEAFDSNWIAPLGPMVDAFEREIAAYVGVPHAAAVASGTAAIHLGLRLLGVKPGDRVLCSSLTFVASANPIRYLGAVPVFIDSDPESGNMSPVALARALESLERRKALPRAAVVVDLYGQGCRYDEILPLLQKYDIPFVEDAAEALGSTYRGKQCGSFGTVGILSFNGNKILNTSGGGMVLTSRKDWQEKVVFWSTQAKDPAPHYEHSDLGYNYRMSNVLAALGRGQLRWLNDRIAAKQAVFARYRETLAQGPGVSFFGNPPTGTNTRWLSVMFLDPRRAKTTRDALLDAFTAANIEARPVWKPLHVQKLFEGAEYYPHRDGQSVSEDFFARGLCLPSGSNLGGADLERVLTVLRDKLL